MAVALATLLGLSAAVALAAINRTAQPASTGSVLWKGDGSEPLYTQWPSISDQEHCAQESSASDVPDSRVTLSTGGLAASASQGRAIRLQLRASDHGCFAGRTELASGDPTGRGKSGFPWTFSDGDEAWIALEAAWPEGYPGGMIQFHEALGPGAPPFGGGPRPLARNVPRLGRFGFHLQTNARPAGPVREFTVGPRKVAANTWYKFVFHAKFEERNTGFLDIYLAEGKNRPKLVYSNAACSLLKTGYTPTHLRIGNYLGTPPRYESVTYIAGFTVATTQAAAEANAFS